MNITITELESIDGMIHMYDDMIEINEDMLSDTLLHGNDMEHAEGILEDTQHLRTARNVLVRLIKESKLIV